MELAIQPRVANLLQHREVQVTWECNNVHTDWTPKEWDEVRIYTTAGVVLRHRVLGDAQIGRVEVDMNGLMVPAKMQQGSCSLPIPDFPGSFIVCIFDFANKCRVNTNALTVEGPERPISYHQIGLSTELLHPFGRLDFIYPSDLPLGYAAIFQDGKGDNDGLTGRNEHYFSSALITLNTRSSCFLIPNCEGKFHIRFLEKPLQGLPRCLAISPPFHVQPDPSAHPPVVPVIQGVITAAQGCVVAGRWFDITWNFTCGGQWMQELDSFVLFTYGRPETLKPSDTPHNTITVPNFSGSMQIQAPSELGVYEMGYFSVREQKVLCFGGSIQVQPVAVTLNVPPCTPVDEMITFTWSSEIPLATPDDRYRIYNDDMSIFGSGPVRTGREREMAATSGSVSIRINRPGTFIMTYWSADLDLEVGQSKPFEVEGASQVATLLVNFFCPRTVPFGRPFEVEFEITGEDLRLPAETLNDTICLYHHEDRDYIETTYFDDIIKCQALQVLPVRGERSGILRFNPPALTGTYDLRYMADTGFHTQATIFRCTFNIVEDNLLQNSLSASQVFRYQTSADFVLAAQERTVLEDVSSPATLLSTRSSTSNTSQSQSMTSNPDLFTFFNTETDFSGSLLTPKTTTVRSIIVVTYHLTSGTPLPQDMIVLLDNEQHDRIYSSVELVDAVGRSDLSLGSLMLRAPEKVGLFIAAYFSVKYGALVLASPPFKVISAVENAGSNFRRSHGKLLMPFGTTTNELENAQASIPASMTVNFPKEIPDAHCDIKFLLCGLIYTNTYHELRGPANDCEILAQVLQQVHHIPSSNILVLTETGSERCQPHSLNIRKAFRWLLQDAKHGSKLFFYYSGHGSFVNSMQGDPSIGVDECIVPLDNDWALRCITFTEIWNLLYKSLPAGASMTSFLDCGHVPSVKDLIRHRQWTLHPPPQIAKLMDCITDQRRSQGVDTDFRLRCISPPQFMFHTHDNSRYVSRSTFHQLFHPNSGAVAGFGATKAPVPCMNFIRSCRRGQRCHDAFIDGRFHGLFAWATHRVLKDFKTVTMDEFMHLTMQYMQSLNYVQHPQLFVSSMENLQFPLL